MEYAWVPRKKRLQKKNKIFFIKKILFFYFFIFIFFSSHFGEDALAAGTRDFEGTLLDDVIVRCADTHLAEIDGALCVFFQ